MAASTTTIDAAATPVPTTASATIPDVPTVGTAKDIIFITYPKLFSRFNYAFHGHEDTAPLAEVVDVICADVKGWLQTMPENFKTSNHALSRPKFGLVFVLKNDQIQEKLGKDVCMSAIDTIEASWEDCKRELVVVKEDEPLLESSDDLRCRLDELTRRNDVLSTAVMALLSKHYDSDIASLFSSILNL